MINKKMIITGGANGIGRACAELFAKNNYIVIVLDKQEEAIYSFDNIDYMCCDISNEKDVNNCLKEIEDKYNNIDVIINNAGIQLVSSFNDYNKSLWSKVFNTNYFGTCNVINASMSLLNNNSTILNILSVHSKIPRTSKYAYDSSKSALEMLTKELALEFAKKRITVNALSFGAVNTDMNREWKTNGDLKKEASSKVPLDIIFESEDIAKFCLVIVEEFSKYTTGSIFTIDGGRSLL